MTALWLLADAVVGEAPPQDEADMETLYDALPNRHLVHR